MDFDSASAIGQAGEREVSQALQRLSGRYGFKQLDNVVLSLGRMTAQLDHVVVDRHGILLVESKVRRGARIMGNDVEKRWTASYGRGQNKPLQNPIAQNREHENMVRQALRQGTAVIKADDIESIVVFVGADITHLDLKSTERSRVLDVKGLDAYFAARDEFQSARRPWPQEWVDYWFSVLEWLDKSSDAETLQRHAAYRQGGAAPALAPVATATAPSPSGTPAAHRSHPATARPIRPHGSRAGNEPLDYLKRVAAMLFVIFLMWACAMSGLWDWGSRMVVLAPLLFPRSATVQPAPAASSPPASTYQQQQRLRELAPDVYDKVTDLDTPQVTRSGDETTYTWHYLAKPTPATVVVRAFSIVFGSDGTVVRMGASK